MSVLLASMHALRGRERSASAGDLHSRRRGGKLRRAQVSWGRNNNSKRTAAAKQIADYIAWHGARWRAETSKSTSPSSPHSVIICDAPDCWAD